MFSFLVILLFSLTAPPPTIAPTCLEVTPTGNGGGVNTTLCTPTSGSDQCDLYLTVLGGEGDPHYFAPDER